MFEFSAMKGQLTIFIENLGRDLRKLWCKIQTPTPLMFDFVVGKEADPGSSTVESGRHPYIGEDHI